MGWTNSAVTNGGIVQLNESLAGHTLTIEHAVGGAGVLDPAELAAAVNVVEPKQTFTLLGIEDFEGGKKVKIQITNKDVTEKYILHQVAAFAKLEYEEEYTMLFIMQDERGVEVPTPEENPDFLFEMFAVIAISNDANIKVNVDSSAVVSSAYMEQRIAAAIAKHDADQNAHSEAIEQAVTATIKKLATEGVIIDQTAIETAVRTAFDTLVAQGTVIDANKVQELIDAALAGAGGGTAGLVSFDFIIPASAWTLDAAAADSYVYYADVANDLASLSHRPDVTLDRSSLDTSCACGMAPYADTPEDGKVRFYAQAVPTADISGRCDLLADNVGSGGGGDEVATDAEVAEMLDDVFGGDEG